MDGWLLRAAPRRYGQARIACAMPVALAQAIAQACARRGARLAGMAPHFIACWNRWRRRIGGHPGILVSVEPGNVVLGAFGPDGWQGLRSTLVAAGSDAVADAVFREKMLLGLAQESPVWVADATGAADFSGVGTVLRKAAGAPALAMAGAFA
jgi:hypothetical protein